MEKFLLPPSRGSASGSALAKALGFTKLTKKKQIAFKGSPDKFVVNWGNSAASEEVRACTVLNSPEAVALAVNKLLALDQMRRKSVRIPSFTTDQDEAYKWVGEGSTVVARHTLTGSSGEGIQILKSPEDFPCEAPLYVKYIPKKSEFRVHVMNDRAFDIQRKMRRKDVPDDQVNWMVRNHKNGFIFGRGDLGELDDGTIHEVAKQARIAIRSLGLDFGAVDIIWNEGQWKAFVLEVNTAPGLEGQTLDSYVREIAGIVGKHGNRRKEFAKFRIDPNFAAQPQLAPRQLNRANFDEIFAQVRNAMQKDEI